MTVSVSVVVPCYRCSDTIERAVRSVAEQTLRPAELILVDDASPDGTAAVLEALRQKYGSDWIRIIRLPVNSGPATARNVGWDAARESYVAFLDSDDAWHPRKLEIQIAWMEAHPEVAVTGHAAIQVSAGDPLPEPGGGEAQPITKEALYASNRFVTPSVVVRREIVQRFEPGKRHMEDYLLWLELAAAGRKIARLPHVLAYTFKAPYGEAGLSAQLWKMEKGELAVFHALRKKRLLSGAFWIFLSAFSVAKFLRRMLMVAAGYNPSGHTSNPALLYAAAYLLLTQSMTALLVFAGLLGNSELAADIGVIQAATIATFTAFAGNARNLILSERTTVPREAILAARLALVAPLAAIAALLCIVVARVDPLLTTLLLARRVIEWIGELHLSEAELLGHRRTAKIYLGLQFALLGIAVAVVGLWPQGLYWALVAWALVPAVPLAQFVVSGLRSKLTSISEAAAFLLPHYGSTAVSGISLYAFRALLVLVAGRAVAGDLFVAFAIGSFPGSFFANILGPSVSLHEERTGRAYLPKGMWLVTVGYLGGAVAIFALLWGSPGLLAAAGKSPVFWLALGWSLAAGIAMLAAQRLRLQLLAAGTGNLAFGADVLAYVCLIAAVPALYAIGQGKALSVLYALNALVLLVFYSTANRGVLEHFGQRMQDWTAGALTFLIFFPVFFLITGHLFNPDSLVIDSGGVLSTLPLPISLVACGAGILLFGRYGRAIPALWTIFGLLLLLLVSTALAHGESGLLERAKMLLMLQMILPAFGLVLGSLIDRKGHGVPYLGIGMLAAVAMTVPAQLATTIFVERSLTLSQSVGGVFGVYQHLQFVPVILVSAFFVALPYAWARTAWPGRSLLALLSGLLAAYAAAALSVLAMFGIAAGTPAFAAFRIARYRDFAAIALSAVALASLAGYNAAAVNTDAFHNKFSFLFPSPDPWVVVAGADGVHRRFSAAWDLVGMQKNGRLLRLAIPVGVPNATLLVQGRLQQGRLLFDKEDAPNHRFVKQVAVDAPGPFEVRVTVVPANGDGHVRIVQAEGPLRGTIDHMEWIYPTPVKTTPSASGQANIAGESSPPALPSEGLSRVRNIAERFADWKRFGEGIFDSPRTVLFGHSTPLPRAQRTSAHNFYIDFIYNFGALALLPLIAMIVYTGVMAWRRRAAIFASESLLVLAVVVGFLLFMENSLKVTLRQPYPGIAVYFLWGLLLARITARD